METSLHQQLKCHFADETAQTEVRYQRYRIDAIRAGELIEIQLGSLAAIRSKIAQLLQTHPVRVVKPLIAKKHLIKRRPSKRGKTEREAVEHRLSPKRETWIDLIHELIYFVSVFPHERLTIEVPLLEVNERRIIHAPRRKRRRLKNYTVEDLELVQILDTRILRTHADLRGLVPHELPEPFHTGQIAAAMSIDRWVAQRIAYCWRKTGTVDEVGRAGNAKLYQFTRHARAA